jgi:hypothetical protein
MQAFSFSNSERMPILLDIDIDSAYHTFRRDAFDFSSVVGICQVEQSFLVLGQYYA